MFKITIEQTRVETVHLAKEWRTVGPPPNGNDGGYGYTPETDTAKTVTRVVYEQTVDELDLKAVIATVNDIGI